MPVIHVKNGEQAIKNVKIARDEGADGVFLINHGVSLQMLEAVYYEVRIEVGAGWFVGANALGLPAVQAIRALRGFEKLSGIWIDSAGYEDSSSRPEQRIAVPYKVNRMIRQLGDDLLCFGGVAFKYYPEPCDLTRAVEEVGRLIDVVTTSGPATGEPPTLEKVEKMHAALPIGGRLAVASGMSPENVEPFLPYGDYFVVATGVSHDFYHLDPYRVKRMALLVHGS